MKESTTVGDICLDGPCGLTYRIGTMTYAIRDDDSFRYTFIPNWDVIDLLEAPAFQGVPGFDLDLRKDEYVRDNITPIFVSERAPSENREDLWALLDACGMEYLDKLEWLIRTDTRYIGDGLYVRAAKTAESPQIETAEAIASAINSEHALRKLLSALCEGAGLVMDGKLLSREERRLFHKVLLPLFEKTCGWREERRIEGVKAAAKRGAYAGRKPKPIDELVLREAVHQYEQHEISAREAAERLGISEATFFRRLKRFRSASGS